MCRQPLGGATFTFRLSGGKGLSYNTVQSAISLVVRPKPRRRKDILLQSSFMDMVPPGWPDRKECPTSLSESISFGMVPGTSAAAVRQQESVHKKVGCMVFQTTNLPTNEHSSFLTVLPYPCSQVVISLIMCPHSDDLYSLDVVQDLVDQTMLYSNTA